MKRRASFTPADSKFQNCGSSGLINAAHSFRYEPVSLPIIQLKSTSDTLSLDAPARLKKELDTVLLLQSDLEASNRALQAAQSIIEKDATQDTLEALQSLERGHDRLLTKVDALYASLNVQDRFLELHGVNLEFVRTLLLARDLKINIRKRAIGSFFEWDKLDRAVGGKQKSLGQIH